ncbi:MAG: phospholipase A [Elusimicrobiota bacterium]
MDVKATHARATAGNSSSQAVLISLCLFFGAPPIASSADIAVTAFWPTRPATIDGTASFWVSALNISTQPVTYVFPEEIKCQLMSRQITWEVSASPLDSSQSGRVTIAPGAFERREYVFASPVSLSDQLTIGLRDFATTRMVLDSPNPSSTVTTKEPRSTGLVFFLKGRKQTAEAEAYDPDNFFKRHILGHEPFYFIAGRKSPNAKFQISFRYRLLNDYGWLAQQAPWLTGLQMAYTQTSLWDWNTPSAPFVDSIYRPELLYSWQRLIGGSPSDRFRFDIHGGLQHESNGKANADSRSMNIAYLRPMFVFGQNGGLQLTLTPRVWAYLGDLDDNPDIAQYHGYADIRVVLGWKQGLQVSTLGRMGKNGRNDSVQVDVTYPLMRSPYGSSSLYFHTQYFTGYGESFLNYKEQSNILRAGFSIYR